MIGLQELFLLRKNLYKLKNMFTDYAVLCQPAFRETATLNSGRPKGGLAMIIPKGWRKYTKIVNCDFWRVHAIILSINNQSHLIVIYQLMVAELMLIVTNYLKLSQ